MKVQGHINILQLLDARVASNCTIIITELMHFDLDTFLNKWIESKKGPLHIGMMEGFVFAIASGLAHMHNKKIMHRDLHSKNILIRIRGYVGGSLPLPTTCNGINPEEIKICDFGKAIAFDREIDRTKELGIGYTLPAGAPPTIAPEVRIFLQSILRVQT